MFTEIEHLHHVRANNNNVNCHNHCPLIRPISSAFIIIYPFISILKHAYIYIHTYVYGCECVFVRLNHMKLIICMLK